MTKYSRQGKLIHTQGGVFLAPSRSREQALKMAIRPRYRVRVIKGAAGFRYGTELGFGNQRQRYAHYSWAQAVSISKKERGENRLTISILVSEWHDDRLNQEFAGGDLKGAIAYAKEIVGEGLLDSVQIHGIASRPFAQEGLKTRATYKLAEVERE